MPPSHGATALGWEPVLGGDEAERALAVARDIAGRLRDPARVARAVESTVARTDYPRSVHWTADGLWQGGAGLALLCGAMDAVDPGDGWDRAGHDLLRHAADTIQQRPDPGSGLSTGLGGVAVAAWALSRGGARYRKLSAVLDGALEQRVRARADEIVRARPHGVDVSAFDVISGLTGVGRYLLLRRAAPPCRRALDAVVRCLVHLSEDDADGVPRWHTPHDLLADSFAEATYPDGNLNLGLAHGIPGPLALLSLAAMHGVLVPGQMEAIDRTARRLCRSRVDDAWGANFPTAVAVGAGGGAVRPSRAAWCYGSPGIARALWLAGSAAGRTEYRALAVDAMEAVYRRPVDMRRIDSPTLCHGVAGLLQVTLRFAHDTGMPVFADAADALVAQILDAYEPGTLVGCRSLEPTGNRIEQPGLLGGAAGVALALLGASTPVEPTWDCVLLLS